MEADDHPLLGDLFGKEGGFGGGVGLGEDSEQFPSGRVAGLGGDRRHLDVALGDHEGPPVGTFDEQRGVRMRAAFLAFARCARVC